MSSLLSAPKFSPASASLPIILQTLLGNPPPEGAQGVPEAWLDLLENAAVAYARTDPEGCANVLETVWRETWLWLKASQVSVRIAAEKALGAMIRYCVSKSAIEEAVRAAIQGDDDDTTLGGMITLLEESFDALPFSESIPHLLFVLSRFISRLRHRTDIPSAFDPRPITAAEILLADLIKYVGELRISPRFEYRERAEDVLGMAIEVLGPAVFLDILPLNLLPS